MNQKSTYLLSKTCLGNPFNLEGTPAHYCVYCQHLTDPNLRHPDYPVGVGECYFEADASFKGTCEHWTTNDRVRFWLSIGYMENNPDGWSRNPWYQLFDDGQDGLKATRQPGI